MCTERPQGEIKPGSVPFRSRPKPEVPSLCGQPASGKGTRPRRPDPEKFSPSRGVGRKAQTLPGENRNGEASTEPPGKKAAGGGNLEEPLVGRKGGGWCKKGTANSVGSGLSPRLWQKEVRAGLGGFCWGWIPRNLGGVGAQARGGARAGAGAGSTAHAHHSRPRSVRSGTFLKVQP